MKADQLTLEQLLEAKGRIQSGVSAGMVTISNMPYTFKTVTEYVAGFYSQLVNGEVLVDSNQKKVGVRSIKGNTIKSGTFQLVESFRVLNEKPASGSTTADDALILAAEFASVAPPSFKNGEFIVEQNAELFRSSGSDVANSKAATSNDDDFRTIAPIVIRGGEGSPFKITIKNAGTPVANHAFKIEWRAIEFTPAPNA